MFVTLGCFQIHLHCCTGNGACYHSPFADEVRLKKVNFPAAQGGKGVCKRQIYVMNLVFHSMVHVVSTLTGPLVSDDLPHPSVLSVWTAHRAHVLAPRRCSARQESRPTLWLTGGVTNWWAPHSSPAYFPPVGADPGVHLPRRCARSRGAV